MSSKYVDKELIIYYSKQSLNFLCKAEVLDLTDLAYLVSQADQKTSPVLQVKVNSVKTELLREHQRDL